MRRLLPWLGLVATVLAALVFASLNARQRVTVDLGLFAFYGVPVAVVAFGGMVVGMVVILLAGIRSDLRVRTILREKARLENPMRPQTDKLEGAGANRPTDQPKSVSENEDVGVPVLIQPRDKVPDGLETSSRAEAELDRPQQSREGGLGPPAIPDAWEPPAP